VLVAVEGTGETIVGDTVFRWKPRDVFVVPSWHTHRHHPDGEAVLFSFSDRPVQEKLGLWREARGGA
jgi:gentisate 1,2-dioxygenase